MVILALAIGFKLTYKPSENINIHSTYQNVSSQELSQMLNQKDFTLIDVHVPEQAHIPGTDALIPYDEISSRQGQLPSDKNAKIVLYCRSGSMSQIAAEELVSLGYRQVYNLDGGLNSWLASGFSAN